MRDQGTAGTENRSWKNYERLVGQALSDLFGVARRGGAVKHNIRVQGASGAGHELDLLLKIPLGEKTHFCAVECKNWQKPVGKDRVGVFRAVLEDLNGALKGGESLRGIMVSRSGFQFGAVELARHHQIGLLEIREPGEKEWEEYLRLCGQEYRALDGTGRKHFFGLSLRTNDRIRVELEEGAVIPWRTDTALSRDPDSLFVGTKSLRELMNAIPGDAGEMHRAVRMEFPGKTLRHDVYGGEVSLRSITFFFDDLTENAQDAVLYGGEKPDILITDRINQTRTGLWKGKPRVLPDPLEQIWDYDGPIRLYAYSAYPEDSMKKQLVEVKR